MRPIYFSLLLILDVFIHRGGSAFARTHREDNGGSAGYGVAARKHTVLGRDAVLIIRNDAALAVGIQTRGGVADQRVGGSCRLPRSRSRDRA